MTAPKLAPLTREQRAMVEANLGLVGHTIKLYYPQLVGSDDAFNDGVIGLARATRDYCPDRAKFSTYATNWIRSEIGNGLGRLNGINARSAHRVGDTYEPPTSLDAALDDWAPLTDLLADPVDPAGTACDRVQIDAVADTLRTAARDPLDHDVARRLIATALGLKAETRAQIAARHGVWDSVVQYRTRRLLGLLRSHLAIARAS